MRIERVDAPGDTRGGPPAGLAEVVEQMVRRVASGRFRPLSPLLARDWRRSLEELAAPAAVLQGLERLEEGALAVVTGQQTGLLGGPLFTLVKAATAVRLADELQRALGRPVVPVFWAASDDHDLGEVNHVFAWNEAGEPTRLRLEFSARRSSTGLLPLPTTAPDLFAEFCALTGLAGDHPLAPGTETLGHWFQRILLHLFGDEGLVVIEPSILARETGPLWQQVLEDPESFPLHLERGAEQLRRRQIEPPLVADADPPLFVVEEQQRTRLRRDGKRLLLHDRPIELAELLTYAQPGTPRLSANVALRPLQQASCLPAVAYVAGPSEAIYYQQLEPLHAHHGLDFPVVVPRPHCTVFPRKALRLLRKLGWTPAEAFAASRRAPEGARPPAHHPRLEEGDRLLATLEAYCASLLEEHPVLKSPLQRKMQQLRTTLEAILSRARETLAAGDEQLRLRQSGLARYLFPRERPQERVIGGLVFWAEYGAELIRALRELEPGPGHWLISPEDFHVA